MTPFILVFFFFFSSLFLIGRLGDEWGQNTCLFYVLLYLVSCKPTCRQHSLTTKDRHYIMTRTFLLCRVFSVLRILSLKEVNSIILCQSFQYEKIILLFHDTFQCGKKLTTLELQPKVYDTGILLNTNPLSTHKLIPLICPEM